MRGKICRGRKIVKEEGYEKKRGKDVRLYERRQEEETRKVKEKRKEDREDRT